MKYLLIALTMLFSIGLRAQCIISVTDAQTGTEVLVALENIRYVTARDTQATIVRNSTLQEFNVLESIDEIIALSNDILFKFTDQKGGVKAVSKQYVDRIVPRINGRAVIVMRELNLTFATVDSFTTLKTFAIACGGGTTGDLANGDKGDITVSAAGEVWNIDAGAVGAAELASTSVTPGVYKKADITVDADGRITSASSGTASFIEVGWGPGVSTYVVPNSASSFTIVDSTFIDVKDGSADFTNTDGLITYTGATTKTFVVSLVLTALNSCDNNEDFTVRIRKNSSTLRQSSQTMIADMVVSATVQGVVTLATNDTVSGQVTTGTCTNGTGLGITDYSIILTEVEK